MTSRKARACWIVGPQRAEIRDVELPPLEEGQVLVSTLYSAISRGTERLVYQGKVPSSEWQRMRAPFQEGSFPGPVKYGYINVGRVDVGPPALIGRTVFSLYPHQTRFCIDAMSLMVIPENLPADRAVLAAGMETAVNALWDAVPKVGDRIAIVGAGVIGSLCGYLATRFPGTEVTLIDSNPDRASVAGALGCGFLPFESGESGPSDVGYDVVFHASGTPAGLDMALRLAGREAKVIELSWYGVQDVSIPLGQAFHSQRLTLVSSQVGQIPACQQARWDYQRRLRCALDLLCDPSLAILISGESRFDDLPATLATVTAAPGPLCHRICYSDELSS